MIINFWKINQYFTVVSLTLVNGFFIVVAIEEVPAPHFLYMTEVANEHTVHQMGISLFTVMFMLVESQFLKKYGEVHGYGTFYSDVIIITACLLMVAVAVYGMLAAMREDVKALYMYFGFLVCLLVLLVFIIIYVSLERFELHHKVSDWLKKDFFYNATGLSLSDQQRLWDGLQTTYFCCGLKGPGDYQAVGKPISISCCPMSQYGKTANEQIKFYADCLNIGGLTARGCEDVILAMLTFDGEWLISVAAMDFGFASLAMLLVTCVIKNATPYDIDDTTKLPL